mgnify:CR=1 FL=1
MSNSPHHAHGLAPLVDFALLMTGGWYMTGRWHTLGRWYRLGGWYTTRDCFFLLLTLLFLLYRRGNIIKKTFYT